jgi:intraflagellar transport protein 140
MDLCVHNNFTITDEIAERLTAPKGVGLDEHTRVGLLEKMGACCTIQGSYHLAAKKYTQAGNKVCMLKRIT